MARVIVTLHVSERDALVLLAQIQRRDPRAQAALIIRAELERRGLLSVHAGNATRDAKPGETVSGEITR